MIRALSSLLIALLALPATAQTFRLRAPTEALEAVIRADDTLTLEVRYRGKTVARTPAVGLDVDGHLRANALPRSSGSARRTVNETIRPVVAEKRAVIPDRYNELRLSFGPKLAATFRAYDDGVAYRFETAIDGEVIVRNESAGLRLTKDDSVWIALVNCRTEPGVDCFQSSYEENYQQLAADAVPDARLAFLPITVQTPGGYVGFTESDLRDYPGLWLRRVPGEPALAGDFARYPLDEQVFGGEFRQSLITRRADYLARTPGTRTFPWRVLMVSPDAAGLLGNDLVYRLASPLELQDVAWIRPGQSTEEWITSRLLYDVDFTSGLNTATYRYYIDFAAEYGVEYMMFDAGWSEAGDNTRLNPDIDVPGLIGYANSKGVGVLLWNEARGLAGNLEQALDRYAAWGARGIMVDFMDRDDQPMLRFQERLAREAAKRHLVVNLHGVAKPTGLQRAYPNLLTREAVLGHEYNMWSDRVTPDHAVTVPFVRMLAGPMDWEGGAMLNGTQKSFRVVGEQPMSQGTRTQQLAQYVIYDSPLQYLAGTPSAYRAEPEFSRFLGGIPTTWDETRPLQGAIGDYVVVARRAGDTWYVAAMTDWTARKLELPLAFLPPGEYTATIVADGKNADRYGADYTIESHSVGPRSTLPMQLAPGGGYVVRLTR